MDTSSKLISEVDSGSHLGTIPKSLLTNISVIESLFQKLLPRQEDLTVYLSES